MTRQFSMGMVLRRTPYKALRWFLPRVVGELEFDWKQLRACDVEDVLNAFERLPPERREEVEMTVREIVSLATIEGVAALNEAAKLCDVFYWETAFRAYSSTYLKAIYAWSSHRNVFETAKKIMQMDRPAYGRRRTGLPSGAAFFSEEKLALLQSAIQSFFLEKEGRGSVCTVEVFDRGNGKYNILAYPDDHEVPKLYHDERQTLQPRMDKSVFEILFAVDSVEGTLETAAKLSQSLRNDLETLFVRTMYGIEPPPAAGTIYDIDAMKSPHFSMPTDPVECVRVEVGMMSIKWDFHKRTTVFGAERGDNIHESVACYMSREELTLEKAKLKRIRLRFYFGPHPNRRAGMVTAEIGALSSNCITNCKDSTKVDVIHKCFRAWGIARKRPEL